MYAEDSFYTLTPSGQVGLAALSFALFVAVVLLTWRFSRRVPILLRVPLFLVVFWSFEWLSPQIYYLYYMTQFEGLPWQSVVRTPPGVADLVTLLSFQGDETLSAHSRGILGWVLLATTVWPDRSGRRIR